MSRSKRPALGRGLGALLPTAPPPPKAVGTDDAQAQTGTPRNVAIEALAPNPDQPRKDFDPAALAELAASIESSGIIQPIVVTPAAPGRDDGVRYLIVAGERRWRAAQRAGLHDVPVTVRETEARERLELALVENIQRADLNPIEEAQAYAELMRLREYTQEELAGRVGKDRSTVANALRLLRLPEGVQDLVRDRKLSMGHARALLGLAHEDDMTAVAAEVVRGRLSVRATERLVRQRASDSATTPEDDEAKRRQIIVGELEDRLRRHLGVRARLRAKVGKDGAPTGTGQLEIPYSTLDELDRLLNVILGDPGQ